MSRPDLQTGHDRSVALTGVAQLGQANTAISGALLSGYVDHEEKVPSRK
jgi:hypothetical protein